MAATRSGSKAWRRRSPLARPVTLGLQRVLRVRAADTGDGMIFDAIGVLHRRPVVQPIPLATACALVAEGVPLTVRRPLPRRFGRAASGAR